MDKGRPTSKPNSGNSGQSFFTSSSQSQAAVAKAAFTPTPASPGYTKAVTFTTPGKVTTTYTNPNPPPSYSPSSKR